MCMQPVAWPEPDPQVAAAIAAMYGSRKTERPLAVLIRDRLGEWLRDEDFAAAFGTRGKPGWSPSRRALVTVLQRAENLTDRRAPMRCGPGSTGGTCWACLLMIRGLATRCWLSSGPGWPVPAWSRWCWMRCWNAWRLGGLVKAGGKQRTGSTHVVAAVAALNRLELAGESVRAALEALAAHPAWLEQRVCVPDFVRRYGTPMTSWRPPASQARRDELAVAYAKDGYAP